MKYSEYGLDNDKKSKDDDVVAGHLYCPYCNTSNLSKGVSLCFSNLAICKTCLATATNIDNAHRWIDAKKETCFKCHKTETIAFVSLTASEIYLCKNCIDWGKQILSKQTNKLLF